MRKLIFIGALGALAIGAISPVAGAKDVDVTGTATCTAGVKAKFKAGPRDPRQIKSNVQIDDVGAVRRTWTITLVDGTQTRTATLRTAGPSNSINRDFFTADNAGPETITFRATRAGASCDGTVTIPG